mmetsp:Transcript_13107/g.9496  ORF Transcript_13107/g.9496 Transcript_13107/m.9496 type:complete len:118 (-) Transcript_13107:54-407(-)
MDLSSGLCRTFDPKYTHYFGDGGGRDTYITSNNGGLLPADYIRVPKTGYTFKEPYSQLFQNQPHHHISVSPRKEATSFRYYGDGSGRDSYVITNSGGLIPKYQDPDILRRFQSSLRQ